MQNKYCLPILKNSKSLVAETIEKNLENYGYFEIWLDYVADLDNEFVSKLVSSYEDRLVFVFRRKSGEQTAMSPDKTNEIINILAKTASMIDLDIEKQKDELDYIKTLDKSVKLICSYHNYEITPPDDELSKIVEQIRTYSPDIIKVATMCNQASDAFRLIGLKKDFFENEQNHIVLGMGEEGKITRVFGALWGNALIFIPETTEEASAPGQLTRAEMDKITDRINNARK